MGGTLVGEHSCGYLDEPNLLYSLETGKETRVIKQEREEEEINGVCCLANDRL